MDFSSFLTAAFLAVLFADFVDLRGEVAWRLRRLRAGLKREEWTG